MLVSGRNNCKEILKNFSDKNFIKKVICMNNFNEKDLLSLIEKRNLKIIYKEKAELDRLAKNNHQGIIMDVEDFSYVSLDEITKGENSKIVILDHLEDPHNLGAIIRTCEAAGIKSVIIPKDRSVGVTSTVMRTSSGALEYVDVAIVNNLVNTIEEFKKNGYFVYAADMDGTNYRDVSFADKVLLVIGSEGNGVGRLVKKSCDQILAIPQYGSVNSLNASVAAGILIYGIVNR